MGGNSIESIENNSSTYEVTIVGDFNINYRKTNTSDFRELKELERKFHFFFFFIGKQSHQGLPWSSSDIHTLTNR